MSAIGTSRFAVSAAVRALGSADRRALFERAISSDRGIRDRTADIIARVRDAGDVALRALALDLDDVQLDALEVSRDRCTAALDRLEPGLRRAMERAATNIATAHRAFLPSAVEVETEPGVVVGRRPDPLGRVGVYAPGGRAAYPSSVLMGAVPARVAGVGEIILCSPPRATGEPSEVVLAAAALTGVDRVFAIGGAGAIAAMAYGTATVPRVDRIVGPGNAFVAEAKLQVSGTVAIDSPAGPSELLVIADETADPRAVAREVMAQAEHDPQAAVVVVAIGVDVGANIAAAVDETVDDQPRTTIIREALATRGGIVTAGNPDEAVCFANEYAPEHLLLVLRDADAVLPRLRNAGTIFIGASSSVVYGDYMTGANHVLPTGSLARSYSGLSVVDFMRWTSWQRVTPRAAAALADDVGVFADAEGLASHAAAARARRTGDTP